MRTERASCLRAVEQLITVASGDPRIEHNDVVACDVTDDR
jgi:hypothetical protein